MFTCNQSSSEDSPMKQDNHYDKGYSSNARSEPALIPTGKIMNFNVHIIAVTPITFHT